ncbi:hypothetical protein B7C42_01668 [Nocardia cerradoensis]|uniref:Uncharacterized protein n=1 Tax=Nocardia cerradoensis TaxID=85688 RepID=A0A231HCK8_9NOCA|nr:hypothetical protein [Nocardia cerradoensis]OXR46693.1 hypothetical protein B7C42_01668 [Nocardia cerradoensis]
MNIRATIKAAAAACLLGVALLGTPAHADAAPAHIGWCPFGHVDPHDDNSACRGSDSAEWPLSEHGPDGKPTVSCTRLNEGRGVRTDHGDHGYSYWRCMSYKDQWGNVYFDWSEVLEAGVR